MKRVLLPLLILVFCTHVQAPGEQSIIITVWHINKTIDKVLKQENKHEVDYWLRFLESLNDYGKAHKKMSQVLDIQSNVTSLERIHAKRRMIKAIQDATESQRMSIKLLQKLEKELKKLPLGGSSMNNARRELIRTLMGQGLTQREISDTVGCSRRTVRGYLERMTPPTVSNLIFNDQHRPFQDDRAVNLMLEVGKRLDPQIITINGDNSDCWEISRFVKHEKLRASAALSHEVEDHRNWLKELRKLFPHAKIVYIFGNHEYRWSVYIQTHAKELYGLRGLSLEEQLGLEELEIEVVNSGNKESSWLWGKLLIGHFNCISIHSAYTAKRLVEKKGISLLQGHSHRGGVYYKRTYDRTIVGYENFCLCDLNPEYTDRPDWQLGFSIVYKDQESDFFFLEQHPIVVTGGRYRVFYKGEVIEG